MCVVIMARERLKSEVKSGIDMFVTTEGNVNDDDYFEKKTGKGKKILVVLPVQFVTSKS